MLASWASAARSMLLAQSRRQGIVSRRPHPRRGGQPSGKHVQSPWLESMYRLLRLFPGSGGRCQSLRLSSPGGCVRWRQRNGRTGSDRRWFRGVRFSGRKSARWTAPGRFGARWNLPGGFPGASSSATSARSIVTLPCRRRTGAASSEKRSNGTRRYCSGRPPSRVP
jgi:hypothetical protein